MVKLLLKILRIVAGTALVIVGIILCFLPGPGVATIVAGLALMADDFPPAKRLLEWMKGHLKTARVALAEQAAKRRARKEQ